MQTMSFITYKLYDQFGNMVEISDSAFEDYRGYANFFHDRHGVEYPNGKRAQRVVVKVEKHTKTFEVRTELVSDVVERVSRETKAERYIKNLYLSLDLR